MKRLLVLLSLTCPLATSLAAEDVPVAYTVDVVVAGGSCGAVATAEAAAKAGAKVLLVTAPNYLGEDVAGTMQLWLEPGEEPVGKLAEALFTDPRFGESPGLHYTYQADQQADKRHPDTVVPSALRRSRKATDPQHESVQYPTDVTITTDFGKVAAVQEIAVTAFHRAKDFAVQDVTVQVSADGTQWDEVGTFRPQMVADRQEFTVPVAKPFRQARMLVRRAPNCERILLGRIRFITEDVVATTDNRAVRPLHAKQTLEKALQAAGVPFLFGCYPTGLLVDAEGRAAGLVMSNRMGSQAVRAKVVVDATEFAVLARAAQVPFREASTQPRTVRWDVIAEQPAAEADLAVRKLPIPLMRYDLTGRAATSGKATWFEYSFPTQTSDDLVGTMALEMEFRNRFYTDAQLFTADRPVLAPPRSIVSRAPNSVAWTGANALPLAACEPQGREGLWVLGGYSDVSREIAEKLMCPVAQLALGARLGEYLAKEVAGKELAKQVTVLAPSQPDAAGTVRESLAGLRPQPDQDTVRETAALPMLGRYDVVVVGGGTSGAPAGIAAARQGAKTLVIEHLHGLGGVGTLGMIGKYWYGNRVGFAAESPQNPIEKRMHFYLSELRKAGGEVWFGSLGCGAVTDGKRVTGVVVVTPFGKGIVEAKVVIDGTGNAEIAAAAGAETQFVEPFFAVQNSHIPPREVGSSYMNGNRRAIDAADPLDVTSAMLDFAAQSFDRGQIIASRERQRIVGDYELDWLDELNGRTFPDSIVYGNSDYDSHGYQVHPYFMLRPARVPSDYKRQFYGYLPYRCLLPKGLDGILVVGLGISVHRDALPIVRMQPELQNIGYAAGLAAAMAARTDQTPREIDVKRLQAELVRAKILDPAVPAQQDSYPVATPELAAAVGSLPNAYDGLGLVLANPEQALPLLRAAYDRSTGPDRLAYAHVLGIMGDAHGVDALVSTAQDFLQKGQFAYHREADGMDRLDQLCWALGRCHQAQATAALIALADAGAITSASRFRAVVVSLGEDQDKAAAPVLRKLLTDKQGSNDPNELMVACALRECDPTDALAKETLQRIAQGNNGPQARLAQRFLAQ